VYDIEQIAPSGLGYTFLYLEATGFPTHSIPHNGTETHRRCGVFLLRRALRRIVSF
jgi:hypothetical protein